MESFSVTVDVFILFSYSSVRSASLRFGTSTHSAFRNPELHMMQIFRVARRLMCRWIDYLLSCYIMVRYHTALILLKTLI
jgi:hypothetical protein